MGSQGSEWRTLYDGPQTAQRVRWVSVPQTLGEYRVKLRYYRLSGPIEVFTYRLGVVPPAQRAYSDGLVPANTMLRWDGVTPALDSPLLVVEGIDAENLNTEAHYYGLGAVLFGTGRERGADVMILNFRYGGNYMQDNALVVRSAIQYINQIKTGSRKLDVAGVSMGGVIVRYALAKMEQDGVAHNVGRFVSMDAPQQGAVVDRQLLDQATSLDPQADPPPATIASAAGKQLLVYNPADRSVVPLHVQFFNELNALRG